MTTPECRTPPMRRGRRFDLRATAMFFALLAGILIVLGFVGRAAAGAVERRPVWAAALLSVGAVAVVAQVRRRRRRSAATLAREAAEALERAATTALDALEPDPREAVPAASAPVPAARGTQPTVVLPPAAPGPPAFPAYDDLTPDEFEQAIAGLCERDGCTRVEVVGGAGDLGADVLALTPDGRRVVIQCKRYGEENKVGSQDLQRFGGTCFTVHEADVAVLVTTSDFTAPALEYADQCGIVCVDGRELLAWTEGLAPEPWAG